MSGPLVVLVVVAIGFVALGLQVLSRELQRYPVDVRRPDPLIDVSRSTSMSLRPAELHHLTGIVADAILSDASAQAGLQPILDDLGAAAPSAPRPPAPLRRRSTRAQAIDRAIGELEARWGLDELDGPRSDGGP